MKNMKKLLFVPLLAISITGLTGCGLSELFGGDTDTVHKSSYEPITGKFILHDWIDTRFEYHDTYFDLSGVSGNFTLKYYENGVLKREGVFQKIVTYENKIGSSDDNLHFNVKCGNLNEHISTYTESLNPINQFRIIEEYRSADEKYYLSELPYVMGTYVREGKEYKQESKTTKENDYTTPTKKVFTSALNGYFILDEEHYFYFLYPIINDYYAFSYFQYYSSALSKPLEGFAQGMTFNVSGESTDIYLTYSREVLFSKAYKDNANAVRFGYYTIDEEDNMLDHHGEVDFSNGTLNSFSFEYLSRYWTDEEWDEFTKNIDYHMPDPIIYDYVGGTYTRGNHE